MFVPNVSCVIVKFSDSYDAYGARVAGERIPSECGVVKLHQSSYRTTVRADSGASRGRAQEYRADAVLLFSLSENIEVDDVVKIYDQTLKVKEKFPRVDVHGALDHFQVDLIRSSLNA